MSREKKNKKVLNKENDTWEILEDRSKEFAGPEQRMLVGLEWKISQKRQAGAMDTRGSEGI